MVAAVIVNFPFIVLLKFVIQCVLPHRIVAMPFLH